MTEINPFRKEKENSIINVLNNYNEESSSENEFDNFSPESLNSLESSYPESTNKKFPNFPIKSIFLPELFCEQNTVKKYLCGLCENVCDEPVRVGCKCGNIFCKKCLNFYLNNEKKECPLCGGGGVEVVEAKKENMIIKGLKMKCVNYKNNCPWEDICEKYKNHIEIYCQEEIINCPNKNHGCVIKLKRKSILEHLGKCDFVQTICNKCGLHFPEKEKNSHIKICEKENIECPYGCGASFIRKELDNHKKVCECFVIKCPFNLIGCNDEFQKKDEKKRLNEDQEKHMQLLLEKIILLQNNFSQQGQSIKKIEEDIQFLKENNNNINYNNINNINDNNEISNENNNSFLLLKSTTKKSKPSFEIINNNINEELNVEENKENILPLEEKESMYNFISDTKKFFFINNNIIEAVNLSDKKHIFVFFDKKYNIPRSSEKKFKIRFKLLSDIKFLWMGFCDKKIVEENNYEFMPINSKNEKKKNNGIYCLGTNKMAWNCNNNRQCKSLKLDKDNIMHKKYTIFEFCVTPIECELEIKINNIEKPIVKFSDVRCFKSDCFSPCLIFLNNCKVETSFFYE